MGFHMSQTFRYRCKIDDSYFAVVIFKCVIETENSFILLSIFHWILFQIVELNWWSVRISPYNGLVLNKRQTIMWIKVNLYICVSKLTIIGSDNGFITTNIGISLNGPLRTNSNEITVEMYIHLFINENAFENFVRKLANNFVSAHMC